MRYAVQHGNLKISSDECPRRVGVGGRACLRVRTDHGEDFDVLAVGPLGTVATVNGVPVQAPEQDGPATFHRWCPTWEADAERAGAVLAELAPKAPTATVAPPAAPPKPAPGKGK